MLTRQAAKQFICELMSDAESCGLDTTNWIVDHVCYRTSSTDEYLRLRDDLIAGRVNGLEGSLLSEANVNGRPIMTMRFDLPLELTNGLVEAIEIPAPKPGAPYVSGFEHIEVVLTENLEDFAARHPNLNFTISSGDHINREIGLVLKNGRVKFHQLPLSCVIALENQVETYKWLGQYLLLEKLAPWNALISGSLPLNLELPYSDLDILLQSDDVKSAANEIKDLLLSMGCEFEWINEELSGNNVKVGRITNSPRPIELFISDTPVLQQNSHRHLLAEYLHLVKHGHNLRLRVIAAKNNGKTTEEAFAEALSIDGDPYKELLHWPKPWKGYR